MTLGVGCTKKFDKMSSLEKGRIALGLLDTVKR